MKDFIWFVKNSFSYMKGYSIYSTLKGMPKAWRKFKQLKHGI